MVLSKRNANGEFVIWTGSSPSQASNNEATPQDAPPFKKPRLSSSMNHKETLNSPYATSQKNPSTYSTSVSSSASNASASAAGKSRIHTSRIPPSDLEFTISSSSNYNVSTSFNRKASVVSTTGITIPTIPNSGRTTTVASSTSCASVPASIPPQPESSSSSSYQTPASSQPRATRGKKKATDGGPTPKPEKRGAIFKKKCPKNIEERVERVRTQRIFMIDRNRVDGELKEEFSVLGSTGNVYTVTIDHKPRCNCPDALKGNHCKHILFIFLKVLQVTQASGYWYQKALLTSELEDIFAHAPLAPNSMAHTHVREAYAHATGKAVAPAANAAAAAKKKRIPGPDDDCPVCYDGMHGVAEAGLVFCEDCGNALHKECFNQWQRTAVGSGKDLTCVWCRAPWVLPRGAGAGGGAVGARRAEGGYLNLAGAGDVSPERDTTTYYHGPRRGQRYHGYQAYRD